MLATRFPRLMSVAGALGALGGCFLILHRAVADGVVPNPADAAAVIHTQPWLDLLNALASDTGPILLAAVGAWLTKHVRDENLRKALLDGVQHEAQGIYGTLVAAGNSYANVPVTNVAFAQAANKLADNFPTAIKLFDQDHDDLERLLRNAFGGLLVADPTVSIAPPSPFPSAKAP